MSYQFDFSFLAERWPDFVAGAWLTVQLTVVPPTLATQFQERGQVHAIGICGDESSNIDSLDNPDIPEGSEGQVPFEELIGEFMGGQQVFGFVVRERAARLRAIRSAGSPRARVRSRRCRRRDPGPFRTLLPRHRRAGLGRARSCLH